MWRCRWRVDVRDVNQKKALKFHSHCTRVSITNLSINLFLFIASKVNQFGKNKNICHYVNRKQGGWVATLFENSWNQFTQKVLKCICFEVVWWWRKILKSNRSRIIWFALEWKFQLFCKFKMQCASKLQNSPLHTQLHAIQGLFSHMPRFKNFESGS